MKNPSSRILELIFKLLEFDLEIKHRPGLWNKAGDCLSRYPIDVLEIIDDTIINEKEEINFDDINVDILKKEH